MALLETHLAATVRRSFWRVEAAPLQRNRARVRERLKKGPPHLRWKHSMPKRVVGWSRSPTSASTAKWANGPATSSSRKSHPPNPFHSPVMISAAAVACPPPTAAGSPSNPTTTLYLSNTPEPCWNCVSSPTESYLLRSKTDRTAPTQLRTQSGHRKSRSPQPSLTGAQFYVSMSRAGLRCTCLATLLKADGKDILSVKMHLNSERQAEKDAETVAAEIEGEDLSL
jgi:hypothetical protein